MSELVKEVTDNSFEQDVLQSDQPVLVDFWAAWCAPCRMLNPTVEAIAEKYAGSAKVVKLNVDENPRTAAQFQIQSIPTMLLFKDGKLIDRLIGAQPKQAIADRLAKAA